MKKRVINKFKNYKPAKQIAFLYFFIVIIVMAVRYCTLDNDFWFLANTGRYIVNNGFPRIEPFTIHSDFSFVVQQWLTDVIFYYTYLLFGEIGMFILILLLFILILYLAYKLCLLVSEKRVYLSIIVSCVIGFLYSLVFVRTRPQMFDFIILLIQLYCLELYIRKKNVKYLSVLPMLSILLINLHSSSWFMLFLFMIPYIIGAFRFKVLCFESEGYKLKPLLLVMLVMFLMGFINPYGIDNITYIFTSYNNVYINAIVNEMRPPIVTNMSGLCVYLSIFLVLFCYLINKKNVIKIRYFLLFLGTTILALSSIKGFSFFITSAIFSLSDYLKEYFTVYDKKFEKNFRFNFHYILCIFFLFICIIIIFNFNYLNINKAFIIESVKYLDKDINDDKDKLKVYTSYDNGAIFEYFGFKTYLDARAEVFLKSNNKKKDVIKEYYELQRGYLDIDKFLEEYNFDYLVIYEKDYLYNHYLNTDKNISYEKIYEQNIMNKNNYYLYRKIEK